MLAINTDITEKKKIEAQFMRAQRMESLGTLAGGIAHDLNNILAPIMMSIDILALTTNRSAGKDYFDDHRDQRQAGRGYRAASALVCSRSGRSKNRSSAQRPLEGPGNDY